MTVITTTTPIQYAYANDIKDLLVGFTLPTGYTDFRLNKECLAASRQIDSITDMRFWQQTGVELYDGNGTSQLTIRHYPIQSINYVRVSTGSGVEIIREYTPSDLALSDFEGGIIQLKPITIDSLDTSWNTATSLLFGHIFPQGHNNIEVSYVYGYLQYTELEELQYLDLVRLGTSDNQYHRFQAIHHNWSSNGVLVYKNDVLLTDDVSIDTKTGIVSIANSDETDIITATYYYTVPHDIEIATAKLAAMSIVSQIAANTTGGITSFKNLNYQETYGARPFSSILDGYKNEIDKITGRYKRFDIYTA